MSVHVHTKSSASSIVSSVGDSSFSAAPSSKNYNVSITFKNYLSEAIYNKIFLLGNIHTLNQEQNFPVSVVVLFFLAHIKVYSCGQILN